MPKKLPPRLEPQKDVPEDPQVTTDLSIDRSYNPEQINTLQHLGLIRVDGERFKSIGELGIAAKSLGLVHLIHGGFMISLENLTQAIGAAGRVVAGEADSEGRVPTAKERAEAQKLVGYLTGQLAKVNQAVTKVEQARAEVAIAVDKQRRQSFAPGVAIPVETSKKTTSTP